MDELPVPVLWELLEYWKRTPPLHVAFMGFLKAFGKGGGKGESVTPTPEDLRAIAQKFE